MSMQTARIAIVGGGLAGLYAAHLLAAKGVEDFVLLEARDAWGGRIVSTPPAEGGSPHASHAPSARFDLGPAWFWPDYQPEFSHLIDRLGLARFAQHEEGDMLIEQAPNTAPLRMRGHASAPPSMRLAGGMGALTDALRQRLAPQRLLPGQHVRRLRCEGDHVALEAEDAQGDVRTWHAAHVLLAVPPRLALARIDFSPALPDAMAHAWRGTPTWTATDADQDGAGHHGAAPAAAVAEGPWRGRITGIASEWSPQFPGYLAGAVEAAASGVSKLLEAKR